LGKRAGQDTAPDIRYTRSCGAAKEESKQTTRYEQRIREKIQNKTGSKGKSTDFEVFVSRSCHAEVEQMML
jgi:hypothetical protein